MAYEIFSRKFKRIGSPQLSLMRTGRIAFNKAATAMLTEQAVENVLLLWDKPGNKIAIRPITKKDPRAYKVHISKRDNGAGFSAVTFMEHIGFDYEKGTKSFPMTWNAEQGIFEVSMAEEDTAQKQPLLAISGGRE
jgi:precorrin-6B methylase 1